MNIIFYLIYKHLCFTYRNIMNFSIHINILTQKNICKNFINDFDIIQNNVYNNTNNIYNKRRRIFCRKNAFEFNSLNRSLTKFFLNIKFQDK